MSDDDTKAIEPVGQNQPSETQPGIRAIREEICSLEEVMKCLPGVMFGDCFPLKHTFATGLYIREITMPKNMLLTSKIHKVTHPYFVLRGDVSVKTERGFERIKAPFSGITLAGTKRVLFTHEETVWTTVHRTDETDLEKIEDEIIARDFNDLDGIVDVKDVEDVRRIEEGVQE